MSDMFEKDKHVRSYALNMWANHIKTANYIETGDVTLSARDAISMGEQDLLNALTPEQQKFVVRLRDMAEKELLAK